MTKSTIGDGEKDFGCSYMAIGIMEVGVPELRKQTEDIGIAIKQGEYTIYGGGRGGIFIRFGLIYDHHLLLGGDFKGCIVRKTTEGCGDMI